EAQIAELKEVFRRGEGAFKAISECGLDYFWIKKLDEAEKKRIKELQQTLFRKQIELAQEVQLPIVVHSRGAEKECLEVLKDYMLKKIKVLFHSFTGGVEIAKEIYKRGYFISFNGILTYKSASEVREMFVLGWKNYKAQL